MLKSTNPRTVLAACKARILVVDSDETFAKFFKIHLNKYFSDVFVTGNPKEALTWFETDPFDLVITDINLPRIGGFSFIKRLRKINSNVSVILMTSLNLTESQQSKISNSDGVLVKPFTMKEFHFCIKNGLHNKLQNLNFSDETRAEAGEFFEESVSRPEKSKAS